MFADISGFTNFTAMMSAKGTEGLENMTRILNDFFDVLINLIYNHGGDIIKFAGDALWAIWPCDITENKVIFVVFG